MRRPNAYAPLSVTFTTDRTGARIQQEHGVEGLGVWAAMIAAAKRGRGQIVFAHDSDWQALGIITPPSFSLRALLKTTGMMKQTSTKTHGHVMYVSLTHYEDWNDDALRGTERERKARSDIETNRKKTGRLPEDFRTTFAPEQEVKKERALTKNSNGSVDLPSNLKGEGESAYALILLLAAVKGTDAVKAQLRSKVERMELAPYAIHSARDELVKARANGKPIRSESAYVLAICERYAEPEPPLRKT